MKCSQCCFNTVSGEVKHRDQSTVNGSTAAFQVDAGQPQFLVFQRYVRRRSSVLMKDSCGKGNSQRRDQNVLRAFPEYLKTEHLDGNVFPPPPGRLGISLEGQDMARFALLDSILLKLKF